MGTTRSDGPADGGAGLRSLPVLRTERLLLRPWRESDLEPFAALNADPGVMQHFPSTLTREQSDQMVELLVERAAQGRPSLWALEVPGVAEFTGFVGLLEASFDAHFTPCVEVGWRLAKEHWGRGYAPEGALAALDWGFGQLELDQVVSFTTVGNTKSRRVMEKIGLHRDAEDDFDHPNLPVGHPMRRHVLYRLGRAEYERSRAFDGAPTGR